MPSSLATSVECGLVIGIIQKLVVSIVPLRRHQNCRRYSTVNSCVKYVQQTTVTKCRRGSTSSVAVSHAGDWGSNPHLYYIFLFIFHKVFTRLGIRLGLGLGLVFTDSILGCIAVLTVP